MDYYKRDERRERKKRTERTGRHHILFIGALAGVAVIVAAGLLFAFYGEIFSYKGLKGLVRVSILGKTPEFHHLVIERNGSDERLTAGDVFKITYRDEFIIKKVSTDSLFEKNITVDAEGLGGANDVKVLLKAVELVDKAMSASVIRTDPISIQRIRSGWGLNIYSSGIHTLFRCVQDCTTILRRLKEVPTTIMASVSGPASPTSALFSTLLIDTGSAQTWEAQSFRGMIFLRMWLNMHCIHP